MPRAKNLKEAYNNFYVEPLKEDQEFEDFYVQRPGHISPMQDLKDRIELTDRKEKYLFLGFRGSGKSTELYRLEAALDRSRFLVVNYSIRDDLNLSDFDFRDFFVSMALKVYDIARVEGIALNPDIEKDFQDFARKITKITEAEVTSQSSAGLSWSRIIILKLSREAKTRECLRKELDQKISDLIQKLNWMILDIEEKSGKELVIMVDDLDKLARGEQSEEFFYKNYPLLIEPSCFVVYTFPIPLAFDPRYENVRHAFASDVILLQMPVFRRNGEKHEEGRKFYRDAISRRIEPELLNNDVLEFAIESTGKLSELMEVMRESSLNALRMGQKSISRDDVATALDKLRMTFDRTLTKAHKEKLLEINECKEARDEGPDSILTRELLFSLTAVEYEDEEGRWCEINLMLRPLVEKWTRSP
ncbi:MAG TPA: hypothetical protein PKL29_07260 [Methanothrix sp.]|jgi:hypothetical protein|nr:hypothetical protein [Methanothrix sp.]